MIIKLHDYPYIGTYSIQTAPLGLFDETDISYKQLCPYGVMEINPVGMSCL